MRGKGGNWGGGVLFTKLPQNIWRIAELEEAVGRWWVLKAVPAPCLLSPSSKKGKRIVEDVNLQPPTHQPLWRISNILAMSTSNFQPTSLKHTCGGCQPPTSNLPASTSNILVMPTSNLPASVEDVNLQLPTYQPLWRISNIIVMLIYYFMLKRTD